MRIIYRYGNIIATLLLSVHFIFSIIVMFHIWYYVFPALINGGIIYVINRYFFKTYRQFPFTVQADNEKIICTDYFFSKKEIVIRMENIDSVKGGLFSGYPTRPVYIHDSENDITIGIYSHVGKFQKLLTKILQNIPQYVYNDLMDKMRSLQKRK